MRLEKNLKEEMWEENMREMDRAISRFLRNQGLAEDGGLRYDLMEIYDLGYDHGSTMSATYPED